MSIVDRISELAHSKGMNISGIEKAVGLSNGIIGKWRKQSPTCDKLKLVADFLGTTIDYLISGNEKTASINASNATVGAIGEHSRGTVNVGSKKNNDQTFDEDTKELIRIFEGLPKREKVRLLNIAYDYEEKYKISNNT